MKMLVFILALLTFNNAIAEDAVSHSALRAALAMADLSRCQFEVGEGVVLSRNPVVVSYTYTLTVGDKVESISFDQDRQVFKFTTDEKTFEALENIDGANLCGKPKYFMIKLNSGAQLIEAQIGDLVCK